MTSSSHPPPAGVRFRAAREFAYRVLVPLVRKGNRMGRAVGSLTHLFQLKLEGLLRPHGEWYDHYSTPTGSGAPQAARRSSSAACSTTS